MRGKKSLDDFAQAFFGGNDGQWKTQDTYAFDDVVATLEGVVEGDWATFLRDRLDGKAPLTGGIEASGWKMVYRYEPNATEKAQENDARGGASFIYSLGINLQTSGSDGEVRWDRHAFTAVVGNAIRVVAVHDLPYGTVRTKARLTQKMR